MKQTKIFDIAIMKIIAMTVLAGCASAQAVGTDGRQTGSGESAASATADLARSLAAELNAW